MLGTRGSLMLDLVAIGMMLIVPSMFASIYLVRTQRYAIHKNLQMAIAITLLIVLVAFEIEMRVVGWQDRAAASPLAKAGAWNDPIEWTLIVHLAFAIPTFFLWIIVISGALRRFSKPPQPNQYSVHHRTWGRWAALGMTLTAVTGLVFYYMAFVLT
jgi:putative membrane protein